MGKLDKCPNHSANDAYLANWNGHFVHVHLHIFVATNDSCDQDHRQECDSTIRRLP